MIARRESIESSSIEEIQIEENHDRSLHRRRDLDDPEAKLLLRLKERHGESVDPYAILQCISRSQDLLGSEGVLELRAEPDNRSPSRSVHQPFLAIGQPELRLSGDLNEERMRQRMLAGDDLTCADNL
jgi:hypothetical protein